MLDKQIANATGNAASVFIVVAIVGVAFVVVVSIYGRENISVLMVYVRERFHFSNSHS